jgi:hypothetical protein
VIVGVGFEENQNGAARGSFQITGHLVDAL